MKVYDFDKNKLYSWDNMLITASIALNNLAQAILSLAQRVT